MVIQDYRMDLLHEFWKSTQARPMMECKATSTGDPIHITTGLLKATAVKNLKKYSIVIYASICITSAARDLNKYSIKFFMDS